MADMPSARFEHLSVNDVCRTAVQGARSGHQVGSHDQPTRDVVPGPGSMKIPLL